MKKIIFPKQAKFEHEELKKWFLDMTDAVNHIIGHTCQGCYLTPKQTQEPERKVFCGCGSTVCNHG